MNDFDDLVSDAVTRRADGAPTDAPDFATVLAARQERLRRRTVLVAGSLVVVGVAGIGLFAAAGDDAPGVAGEPSSTMPGLFATTTILPGLVDGDLWFCTGRVDHLFSGIDPVLTTIATARPEDSGYFRECALVGGEAFPGGEVDPTTTTLSDGEVTAGTAPPLTTIPIGSTEAGTLDEQAARMLAEEEQRRAASQVEARRLAEDGIATHIVAVGEEAFVIAERYCVGLDDLLDSNGWTSGTELPLPGGLVVIPPATMADCGPLPPPTTGG